MKESSTKTTCRNTPCLGNENKVFGSTWVRADKINWSFIEKDFVYLVGLDLTLKTLLM